jgi:hypothetical protein
MNKVQKQNNSEKRVFLTRNVVPLELPAHEHYYNAGCTTVKLKKLNSVAVVCKRTIPTERPPLVGEVSANLCE